jgi:hypothetical protein
MDCDFAQVLCTLCVCGRGEPGCECNCDCGKQCAECNRGCSCLRCKPWPSESDQSDDDGGPAAVNALCGATEPTGEIAGDAPEPTGENAGGVTELQAATDHRSRSRSPPLSPALTQSLPNLSASSSAAASSAPPALPALLRLLSSDEEKALWQVFKASIFDQLSELSIPSSCRTSEEQ